MEDKKVYKTDLDYSIIDKPNLTEEELLEYISSKFFDYKGGPWTIEKIYRFVKIICKMEKVTPSIEQFIYILCNKDRILNEACAGAGKTTMSKYRMLLANACYSIPGNKILAIAYNHHAAEDIKEKYQLMVRKINNQLQPKPNGKQTPNKQSKNTAFHVDSDVRCSTFHSWCLTWVNEYASRFQLKSPVKDALIEQEKETEFMRNILNKYLKKTKRDDVVITDAMVSNLISLNNWIRETLTEDDPQAWVVCSSRIDLGMFAPVELLDIFSDYARWKSLLKKVDYQDLVFDMYELVKDPVILKRLRAVYQYIVIDEYQDITPSMLRIIKLFFEGDLSMGLPRYDDGTLVCIGDGDQAIYGFRGTDSENCIRFKEDYPSAVITAMSINRRCDKVILDYARKVIESNTNRIEKPIRGLHDGGEVITRFYNDEVDEVNQIIDKLRGSTNLRKTCICYRNLLSSQYLVARLLEAGIPFNTKRGVDPFSDIYSKSINDLFYLLEFPQNLDYAKRVIYKFVPRGIGFTKDGLRAIFDKHAEELKNSTRGHFVAPKNFWEHDFGDWNNQNGFREAMDSLRKAHMAVFNNSTMNLFMPTILKQLRRYFIDSLRKGIFSDKLSDNYMKFVEKHYTQVVNYDTFRKEQSELMANLKKNKDNGVVLTTMHGLKGLEFDSVFVIDMDDNLYPGNELKNPNLTNKQREKIEWEARRLLYVTVTRAKHELLIYFKQTCPSRYLKFFIQNDDLSQMYKDAEFSLTSENTFSVQVADMTNTIQNNNDDDEFIIEDYSVPVKEESSTTTTMSSQDETHLFNETVETNETHLFNETVETCETHSFNDSSDEEDNTFDEMFDSIDSTFDLIDSEPDDNNVDEDDDDDISFDDNIDLLNDEDDSVKENLPWAEDEDNSNYKPKLATMLQILRNKGVLEDT